MDQNSRENLVRLRKRSILQNQKATVSLEEFWTTEASLREYFYDLPGPQVELPAVLLHLSPDHNKAWKALLNREHFSDPLDPPIPAQKTTASWYVYSRESCFAFGSWPELPAKLTQRGFHNGFLKKAWSLRIQPIGLQTKTAMHTIRMNSEGIQDWSTSAGAEKNCAILQIPMCVPIGNFRFLPTPPFL